MQPMWTQEVKLYHRRLDPLGLSRVSQWATDQLLPGITSVTHVARNYSFYCWAINNLLKENKVLQRNQFASQITKRESAYVISSILHEQSKAVKQSPHGYDKATHFIDKSENGKLQVDFDVSDGNSEGFYGLYYATPMTRLGLTLRSRVFDDLTPLGRELASCYEQNIKDTQYLKHHVQDNDVDKDVLVEYGNSACICRLVEHSKERDLLRKVMFSKNYRASVLEKSRVETLGLVLYLIKQCKDLGIDFTENTFRDAVYFGQTTNGQSISSLDLQGFREIASRWQLFQLHEYLTYALESLLHALLGQLKRKEEGLSFDDFLKLITDPSTLVAETLNVPRSETIEEFIKKILSNYGLKELSQESSLKFSHNCNLTSPISERILFVALQESNKQNDLELIVGQSIGILLLNYIRSLYLLSSVDPITLWFNNRAIVEWSPPFFAQEIKSRAAKWSIENLVGYYFAGIVDRHDIIALEKRMAGNDTFRYEEKAGRLRFRMDIYPNYPTQRSSRINSVISILQQLGLIEVDNKIKTLTADGEKFLGECMNDRSY